MYPTLQIEPEAKAVDMFNRKLSVGDVVILPVEAIDGEWHLGTGGVQSIDDLNAATVKVGNTNWEVVTNLDTFLLKRKGKVK
jgi:hypothetical protein